MKSLIFIFLILTTISNIKGSFSIGELLNYLQEKGLYELLVEVKLYFGTDISISICKEMVKTYDCEEIVRIYISPSGTRPFEDRETKIKKAKQLMNEYRIKLIKAGVGLNEIDEMLEILMKAS